MMFLKYFSFVLILNLEVFCSSQDTVCVNYRHSLLQRGLRLDSTFTYDASTVNKVEDCIAKCAAQSLCRSMNYLNSTKICELNIRTLQEEPTFKVEDDTALYTDISQVERTDKCSGKICKQNEKCVVRENEALCLPAFNNTCSAVNTTLPHATMTSSCEKSQNSPGSLCTWSCDTDYKAHGRDFGYMICLTSGEWSSNFECALWFYDCYKYRTIDNYTTSGSYNLTLHGVQKEAYCDMTIEGGGWTTIATRKDGSVNFQRNWVEYKFGFGDILGEHWLGNEYFYHLTKGRNYDAYFKLQLVTGTWMYSVYENFKVSSESDGYRLYLRRYLRGNAGNVLKLSNSGGTAYGQMFSTYDRDQDLSTGNKAASYKGGWWYKYWAYAPLNSPYNSKLYKWYKSGRLRYSSFMVRPHL